MKKVIIGVVSTLVVVSVVFFIGLFIFNKDDSKSTSKKVTPIFEGISLIDNNNKAKKVNYGSLIPEVNVDSTLTYFTGPNESLKIGVYLKNPSQFEILSLTINERKYQSYEFSDGSNSAVIYLDITAPSEPGEHEYLIDNIKYVDGQNILDVDMSNGNKNINFGVTYQNIPTISIYNEEIDEFSYKSSLQVIDPENIIERTSGLKFYLFDAENIIVKSGSITKSISITNLNLGSAYHFVIACTFDPLDGKGTKTFILVEKDINTE